MSMATGPSDRYHNPRQPPRESPSFLSALALLLASSLRQRATVVGGGIVPQNNHRRFRRRRPGAGASSSSSSSSSSSFVHSPRLRIPPPRRASRRPTLVRDGTYVDLGDLLVDRRRRFGDPPPFPPDCEVAFDFAVPPGRRNGGGARSDMWIVLIDDEPAIRLAVGDYLRSAGCGAVTACDGPTSFLDVCLASCSWSILDDVGGIPPPWMGGGADDDLPRWRLPDCVISDIRMPGGIDGIKLLQLMRRPPPPPPHADDDDDDDDVDDEVPLQPRRGRGRPRKDGADYYYAVDHRLDGGGGSKDEYDPLPATIVVDDDGGTPGGGRIITPADQAAQRIDAIHGCISYVSRRDGIPSRRRRRRRRRPDSLRDVPVILLTARAMVSDRIVGYGSGADGYLPKPFRPEELLGMIDNLMRRRGGIYGNDDDDDDDDGGGGGGEEEGGDIDEKGGGDLTTEQAREIADELGEIKELIRARMGRQQETSTDGNDLKEKLRPLLPEAIWMFRTGERRKRVFTRDHIKSILSSCYGVDLTSKKNAGWDVLRKELERRCSERPERLSCSDMPI